MKKLTAALTFVVLIAGGSINTPASACDGGMAPEIDLALFEKASYVFYGYVGIRGTNVSGKPAVAIEVLLPLKGRFHHSGYIFEDEELLNEGGKVYLLYTGLSGGIPVKILAKHDATCTGLSVLRK